MASSRSTYILKLSCPDRIGIVAAVAGFLSEQDCNIIESAQFNDEMTGRFFMRTVVVAGDGSPDLAGLSTAFAAVGKRFGMEWELHDAARKPRVLILVSKFDHCLNDLLYRYRTGDIPMEIPAIVSNHPDLKPLADFYGLPYHHLPVTKETRAAQEAELMGLVESTRADIVVLARYMQILSDDLCRKLHGRAINIHHSFLPSFKGAKPYHQAHARGVKLIGATAHYVTEALDEGPIIEQETVRVSHAETPEQLVAVGRDVEKLVLARALKCLVEHRVLLNGNKTVVFH
ncbi:MAG TPA: formyltetrahydrofolate deformylase [Alphaproteobacteria bacterium]|jgi:formyltetrahydrofolate deformylase